MLGQLFVLDSVLFFSVLFAFCVIRARDCRERNEDGEYSWKLNSAEACPDHTLLWSKPGTQGSAVHTFLMFLLLLLMLLLLLSLNFLFVLFRCFRVIRSLGEWLGGCVGSSLDARSS